MRIDLGSLSKETKRPLHQQLAEVMRGAIRAGVYQPGEKIESERELVKYSRLSQPTVTRAMKDLAEAGWVVRRTGSGTFVNRAPRPKTRGLKKVGVFYYDTTTAYFERLYAGIQAGAAHHHIEVVAVPAGIDLEHEDHAIRELEQMGVDGLIAIPFGTELMQRELRRLIAAGMPVISIGLRLPEIPCDAVGFDNHQFGQLIAHHLLDLQHRRLAFVSAEFRYPDTSSLEILEGLRQECTARGLDLPDGNVVRLPTLFHQEKDQQVRQQILDLFDRDASQRPTALVCATDGLAYFAYTVLGEAGFRIPADVSITGGGDLPLATQLDPPLTTVGWPLERVGQIAVRMLLDRHDHPERSTTHRVLDTQLTIRRSTGMSPTP